ncbi:ABC transporter permease [candidate division KSB1 bacterium]
MFKNYIKVALRNMYRQKIHTSINIFGLSIGIACSILFFIFIKNEYSYDEFHENSEIIYRIWQKEHIDNRETLMSSETPYPLAGVLKELFPEIDNAVRYMNRSTVIKTDYNSFQEIIYFVDQDFLDIFTFPLIEGDMETPLKDVNSVVITRSMGKKYFGDSSPVGQKLSIQLIDSYHDFTVTAVAEDPPENSSLNFQFLIPFDKCRVYVNPRFFSHWGIVSPETFIRISPETDPIELQAKFDIISEKYYAKTMGGKAEYLMQPLTDIHLNKDIPAGRTPVSDPVYSYILAGIGVLILFIACINFITLSIGRASARSREVGMRKVMGAFRSQVTAQYIGEAVILTFFSMIAGLIIAGLLLPVFNSISGKQLVLTPGSGVIPVIAALLVLVGIVAGSYPAVVLSGFQPVSVLKGVLSTGKKHILSRVLVIIQFSLSILLIICTFLMQQQLDYIRSKNLGYDRERVVVIENGTQRSEANRIFEVYKNELEKSDMVVSVGGANNQFGIFWTKVGYHERSGEFREFFMNLVDHDYIPALGMEIVQGRNFSNEFGSDQSEGIIVNEAFVKYYGWSDPLNSNLPDNFPPHRIIGVVKDFNFSSLHDEIRPLALVLSPDVILEGIDDIVGSNFPILLGKIIVRISPGETSGIVEYLKSEWAKVAPNAPFNLTFVDETIDAQYRNDRKWSTVINYASYFAVIIACMGLFGLAALSVDRRIKEIGIRKVMGASTGKIVSMVSTELMLLVIASNILAWPAAYIAISRWLQDFAFRINIGIFTFLAAGLIAALIAFCTISYQSIKAAITNPVDTLRYE